MPWPPKQRAVGGGGGGRVMEAGVGVEACHGLEQLAASKRFEMEGWVWDVLKRVKQARSVRCSGTIKSSKSGFVGSSAAQLTWYLRLEGQQESPSKSSR